MKAVWNIPRFLQVEPGGGGPKNKEVENMGLQEWHKLSMMQVCRQVAACALANRRSRPSPLPSSFTSAFSGVAQLANYRQ